VLKAFPRKKPFAKFFKEIQLTGSAKVGFALFGN
jgi:hypothetical protein